MSILDKLQRRLAPFAVPNLTLAIILPQVAVYFLKEVNPQIRDSILLKPRLVLDGQVWRLISFLADPPITNPIFALMFWMFFYFVGTALEQHWGVVRYNGYMLLGYVATVAVSFIEPDQLVSNGFLQLSAFLAFGYLYPEMVIRIYFILPVKIKWLAAFAWAGIIAGLVLGSWPTRLMELASVANFFVFFGPELVRRLKSKQRQARHAATEAAFRRKPFHTCTVCGITDWTHPQMDFRYCSKCEGTYGYCSEHLHNHEHIKKITAPAPADAHEN